MAGYSKVIFVTHQSRLQITIKLSKNIIIKMLAQYIKCGTGIATYTGEVHKKYFENKY